MKYKLGDRVVYIGNKNREYPHGLPFGSFGIINKVNFDASKAYKEPIKHWDYSIDWNESGFADLFCNESEICFELASEPVSVKVPENCPLKTHNFDLQYCKECNQMTNHLGDKCQKCKLNPLAEVIMETRKEFEEKFSTYNLNDEAIYNGKNWKAKNFVTSHINETIIKVLEKMREECEGKRQYPPQPVLGMGGDMTKLFERIDIHNACLQFQIGLINQTIKQIK